MNREAMNDIAAKEFSDALARCNQQGIDPGTVRTGLLTIAIANFVNGIGLNNTVALFEVLPQQIRSGMFDRFVDPSHAPITSGGPAYPETVSVTQQQPIDVRRHSVQNEQPTSQPQKAPEIKRRRL